MENSARVHRKSPLHPGNAGFSDRGGKRKRPSDLPDVPAGSVVLSAVGTGPPHVGVQDAGAAMFSARGGKRKRASDVPDVPAGSVVLFAVGTGPPPVGVQDAGAAM